MRIFLARAATWLLVVGAVLVPAQGGMDRGVTLAPAPASSVSCRPAGPVYLLTLPPTHLQYVDPTTANPSFAKVLGMVTLDGCAK